MKNLRAQHAELMAAFNKRGVWDTDKYDEIKDLESRIALLPPEAEPEPQLDLDPAVPKKGR